jgi:hypothetical protein
LIAALLAFAALAQQPSDQVLIYYNARMALREGHSLEAAKLWLLRNTVENTTGEVSPYDDDFGSVTWAALGDLGVCQDGHPTDEAGAGLWPLALHNWVVRNMGRRKIKTPRPFASFEVGRQQRRISIDDVLSADELRAVKLGPGRCVRPRLMLFSLGDPPPADMSDPGVVVPLMLSLLDRAAGTLATDRVVGTAAIEARRFDLHLEMMALAAREAARQARARARRGREVGLSRESLGVMGEDAPAFAFDEDSEPAAILRASVGWPPSEWMALSPERRMFLFDQARAYGGDPAALDAIALGVIDALAAAGDGKGVDDWIGRFQGGTEAVWDGPRGLALLSLDPASGFGERGTIALHRGVHQLEGGDLPGTLRSLAYALQQAPESRVGDDVAALSRRWLSYTASQFDSTSELLVTLRELVPARDYAILLEDLMWRAALRADRASFDRGMAAGTARQGSRAALDRRLALLGPLASGDVARFTAGVRAGLVDSPAETLRFLDSLVERIEREEADVRAAQLPTLTRIRAAVEPLAAAPTEASATRQSRIAQALVLRTGAILEGAQGLGADASASDRARALAPSGEVFAGSVRLAPADTLPWPFHAAAVTEPSVFAPLALVPREWRDPQGTLVFGWSIGG